MEPQSESLKHRELTETIIGVFYDVYNELGLLFDNERKKIRENPCKSVARVSA